MRGSVGNNMIRQAQKEYISYVSGDLGGVKVETNHIKNIILTGFRMPKI